jgi:nicotinamidase-related amidase
MADEIWSKYLTPRDRQVLERSGYGARMGYGRRPALMIVDVSYNFCGDAPAPILDSIARWRNSCGEDAWRAIDRIKPLAAACRARGVPVFYSTNQRRPDGFDAGSWRWKNARELEDNDADIRGNRIVADIAPQPQDVVVYKTKPSAFFGTPLLSFLIDLKVDSLLVCGVSTSGCVRATVIDAFSNNLRCAVIADGCFDRIEASHAINLFDMHAKYADVVTSDEAIAFVESLPERLFELPGARAAARRAVPEHDAPLRTDG